MRGGNRPAAPDPRESKGLSRGSAEGHYRKGCPADKATGGFLNLPNGFPPDARETIAKDVRNHPMVASTDARLSGFERGDGHGAGESVTDEVSGTFTLVEITPARYAAPGSREEFFGTRATAHFCYVPAPGFELGPMLNSKQRMRPPVRKSPAGGPPQTPTGGQPPSSRGQSAE